MRYDPHVPIPRNRESTIAHFSSLMGEGLATPFMAILVVDLCSTFTAGLVLGWRRAFTPRLRCKKVCA
jgi:hypothetical protein